MANCATPIIHCDVEGVLNMTSWPTFIISINQRPSLKENIYLKEFHLDVKVFNLDKMWCLGFSYQQDPIPVISNQSGKVF